MKSNVIKNTRTNIIRGLAFIGYCIINTPKCRYLYDMTTRTYHNYSFKRNGIMLKVFDCDRQSFISGRKETLYDYSSGDYYRIMIINKHHCFGYINGCDPIDIRVMCNDVIVYSFKDSKYYQFIMNYDEQERKKRNSAKS